MHSFLQSAMPYQKSKSKYPFFPLFLVLAGQGDSWRQTQLPLLLGPRTPGFCAPTLIPQGQAPDSQGERLRPEPTEIIETTQSCTRFPSLRNHGKPLSQSSFSSCHVTRPGATPKWPCLVFCVLPGS